MLVRKGNESLLHNSPFLNNVLIWDKKKNKVREILRLLGIIRNAKFDVVINLQRFASSGILTAFSGAKEKIGFDKNPFSFLFDTKIPHVIGTLEHPGKHEVERCLTTIQHLTDEKFQGPVLYPSAADQSKVKEFLDGPFITISPASVWFTKQTPPEVWKDFISQVSGYKIYLLGAAGDFLLCKSIASGNENVGNLAGKLSLLQSAALMSKAKMNYTNDSAPMHLCSAMNAPVTAVYCSTIPAFGFGPLSDKSFVVESHEVLSCRPCGLHGYKSCPLGHFKCSHILSEDLVKSL